MGAAIHIDVSTQNIGAIFFCLQGMNNYRDVVWGIVFLVIRSKCHVIKPNPTGDSVAKNHKKHDTTPPLAVWAPVCWKGTDRSDQAVDRNTGNAPLMAGLLTQGSTISTNPYHG